MEQRELDALLRRRLDDTGDAFLDHDALHARWRWQTAAGGTVAFSRDAGHGPSPAAAERLQDLYR